LTQEQHLTAVQAFLPLLEKNRKTIESVRRETIQYGDTERHKLDVYHPPSHEGTKPPILIFVYGGAFTRGDRIFPAPADLIYRCVGAFFASRGFLTIIPDYRLVPHVKYPQPVEDVRDALHFVAQHLGDAGDTNNIFMYGHSAGGSIVTSLLLHEPALVSADVLARVKGVMSLGAPHLLAGPAEKLPEFVVQLYGDAYEQLCPCGLLRNASSETLAALPPLFVMRSEKEPPGLMISHDKFLEIVRERAIKDVKVGIAAVHNHVSPELALSTGEGEEWGNDLIAWIKSLLS